MRPGLLAGGHASLCTFRSSGCSKCPSVFAHLHGGVVTLHTPRACCWTVKVLHLCGKSVSMVKDHRCLKHTQNFCPLDDAGGPETRGAARTPRQMRNERGDGWGEQGEEGAAPSCVEQRGVLTATKQEHKRKRRKVEGIKKIQLW
ncbi:hypothetical protein HJG60_012153 [Phyllostomus discolor]|uniref:Uncharacterized protein n=1 Tax=Phyllostomus discolor TaxID=89673 RepID=A0A834DWG3_9CHIR|nr:hypothetical protein HJG60_012153 [Phyllostomus discolor]